MNKSKLLNQFFNMEIDYVSLFSEIDENKDSIKFTDSNLPEMYTHNFTLYKSKQGLVEFITKEIEKSETRENGFYRIETFSPISNRLLKNLPLKPQVCTYDLMYIETKKFTELRGNHDCKILMADNEKVLEDGIIVDVTANQEEMGLNFAKKRIERKAKVYRNDKKDLQLFVCYSHEVPIGNIEYMQSNGIVKLEDFDIILEYQRKGFGTSLLRHLIELAYNNNIGIVYLITDNADTAKEMYKKNGFMKIGEKTELLFYL